jgi:hypothetical protein
MQSRPITAMIVVFSLVAASLLAAGCTAPNTSQSPSATSGATSSATSSAAAQHDAFLENFLAQYKDEAYSNSSFNVTAWDLEWLYSTSARLEYTYLCQTTSYNYVQVYIVLPTTQDAAGYLTAMNKTEYSLVSTQYPGGGAYEKATGHAPEVYKQYAWTEGNASNFSEYRLHFISQIDRIIVITTGKRLQ